jgi:hypothetical protein
MVAAAMAEHMASPGGDERPLPVASSTRSWRWIETTATNLLDEPAVAAVILNLHDVTAEAVAQQLLEGRSASVRVSWSPFSTWHVTSPRRSSSVRH